MTTYYVDDDGSMRGTGTKKNPFDDISDALKVKGIGADDTVVVRAGLYCENVWIANGGRAGAYFTLKGLDGARIDASGNDRKSGIQIADDYVKVEGFEVFGSKMSGISAQGVHHVQILDNESHHNKRAGIYAGQSDALLIEGNETYGNASSGPFSGISVHRSANLTNPGRHDFMDGYDIIVRDNVSYQNHTRGGKNHTDGHGIILDDNRATKHEGQPEYQGEFLVEGNYVYSNGGDGIRIAWTDNVDVVGNVAYRNNRDLSQGPSKWRGDITISDSSDVDFVFNVAIADPKRHPMNRAFNNVSSASYDNQNVDWFGNFSWSGKAGDRSILTSDGETIPDRGNHLGVDPKFIFDPDKFAFKSDSPVWGVSYDWGV